MQMTPNMEKCLWPWSLFPEADRIRVCSVYPVTENHFEIGGGQVTCNKFWSRCRRNTRRPPACQKKQQQKTVSVSESKHLHKKKKKRIRICRSDPALVFHMAVTTITAGMKPLPARLHHVYWDCDLDNDDSELFFSARHSTVCLVIIHQ